MDCGAAGTRREDGEAGRCSAHHPYVPAKQPTRKLSKHGNSPLIPASAGTQSLRKKPGSPPEPDPDRGGERAGGRGASPARHRRSSLLEVRTDGGENRVDRISRGERRGPAGHDGPVSHRQSPAADGPFHLIEGERWYVVHTQPHRESRAQAHLTAQGFRAFLPRHRKTVRHARKLKTVSAPLFPCYLFVVLDLGRDRWRSVNGTFGVLRLVAGDESPIPVPAGVVASMVAKCGSDGHLNLGRSLEVGDRVRVLSGPFADLIGELTRIDGAERVRVLLRLLGSEIPVSIGARRARPHVRGLRR